MGNSQTSIKTGIYESVNRVLFSEEYSDLVFAFEDGTRINAHQMVVFQRSEYFKAFGSWEKRQVITINIEEYSPEEIKKVLTFLYTDVVSVECIGDSQLTMKLIEMSRLFQIPELQVAVANLWLNNERYEVEYDAGVPVHRRTNGFGIEVAFFKLCKLYPEILEMENIGDIASFITANMFKLVKDASWKAAVEADQIDLKTLSKLICIGQNESYVKRVVAKKRIT